jgi:hypothetical protein
MLAKRWDAGLNTGGRIEARPCHVTVGTWVSVTIARTAREEAKSGDSLCIQVGGGGAVYGAERTEI